MKSQLTRAGESRRCAERAPSRRRWRTTAILFATTIVAMSWGTTSANADASPAAGPGVAVTPGESDSSSGAHCAGYYFPVAERENERPTLRVFGEFCSRAAVSASTPVQILVHGGTYDHHYWDWPYQPEKYSYVRAATERGYATLNIDQLGAGRSDHPDPMTLDFTVQGYVLHQLVQALRGGSLGHRFERVIANGHSMGALTVQHEASAYHDVDGVILSGVGHNFNFFGSLQFATEIEPAGMDPKFAAENWPLGYVTTIPGDRAAAFLAPGIYDEGILATEEKYKDVMSPTELAWMGVDSNDPAITAKISAPVLDVLGQFDGLWCTRTHNCDTDADFRLEQGFYPPTTSFTRFIVPAAGHSINICANAPVFYDKSFDWLRAHHLAPS